MSGVTFEHLDDASLGSTATIRAGDADQHFVAVEHLAHLPGMQVQVFRVIVRNQKSIAIAICLHRATHKIHARDEPPRVATVADQLPVASHRFETPPERRALLIAIDSERIRKLVECHRHTVCAQRLHDIVTAGDR